MLGGIAASACIHSLWAGLCVISEGPFYRLTAFLTLSFLIFVGGGLQVDRRVQALPYSKVRVYLFVIVRVGDPSFQHYVCVTSVFVTLRV